MASKRNKRAELCAPDPPLEPPSTQAPSAGNDSVTRPKPKPRPKPARAKAVTGVEGGEQVAPETEPLRRDAAAITQQDDQHTEKPDIQMDEPVPAQKLPRGGRAKTNPARAEEEQPNIPAHPPARYALRTNPAKLSWGEAVGTPSGALALLDAQLASVDADSAEKDRQAEDAQRTKKMKAVTARIAALEALQAQSEQQAATSQWLTEGGGDEADGEADEDEDGVDMDAEANDGGDGQADVEEVVDDAGMVVDEQDAPGSVRGSASSRSFSRSNTPSALESSDDFSDPEPAPKRKAAKNTKSAKAKTAALTESSDDSEPEPTPKQKASKKTKPTKAETAALKKARVAAERAAVFVPQPIATSTSKRRLTASAPEPSHTKKQKSADPALVEDWQSIAKTLKKAKNNAPAKDAAEQVPLGGLNDDDTISSRPQATSAPGQRRAQLIGILDSTSSAPSSPAGTSPLAVPTPVTPAAKASSAARSRASASKTPAAPSPSAAVPPLAVPTPVTPAAKAGSSKSARSRASASKAAPVASAPVSVTPATAPAAPAKRKARARKVAAPPAPAPAIVAPAAPTPTAAPPAALGSHRGQPLTTKPTRGKSALPSWALPVCHELVAYTTDRVGILQNPWDYKKHIRVIIREAVAAVVPGASPTAVADPEVFKWVRQKAVYEWMQKFYATASALVFDTYGSLTAEERDKVAEDALYNTRFAFCKEPHPTEPKGAFLSEWVLRTFATHLALIDLSCYQVSKMDGLGFPKAALLLAVAAVQHAFIQISMKADPDFGFNEDKITRTVDQWAHTENGGVGRIYKDGKAKVWRTIMIESYAYVPEPSASDHEESDDDVAVPTRNPASAVFDRSSPVAPDVTV